jgi:urease accessory protein
MQLADSALPIGTTAHSFGLESLTVETPMRAADMEVFFHDYLEEAGRLESIYCRKGHRLATYQDTESFGTAWCVMNRRISAQKTARESRNASITLGRRFLRLVVQLEELPQVETALQAGQHTGDATHYSPAFGLVGGLLGVDVTTTVLAYLQQTLLGLISASQRLLPLGQSQASQLAWRLKPVLLIVAQQGEDAILDDDVASFTPLVDIGSMRHPTLKTRLFIS